MSQIIQVFLVQPECADFLIAFESPDKSTLLTKFLGLKLKYLQNSTELYLGIGSSKLRHFGNKDLIIRSTNVVKILIASQFGSDHDMIH